jgi:hypothetical protein
MGRYLLLSLLGIPIPILCSSGYSADFIKQKERRLSRTGDWEARYLAPQERQIRGPIRLAERGPRLNPAISKIPSFARDPRSRLSAGHGGNDGLRVRLRWSRLTERIS